MFGKRVRELVWFTPFGPLCPFKAAIVWRWGPWSTVLYRDRLNGKCYTETAWHGEYSLCPRDKSWERILRVE